MSRGYSYRATFATLLGLTVLIAGFQLATSFSQQDYIGFSHFDWQELEQCRAGGGYHSLTPPEASVGTWLSGGGENQGSCTSGPVQSLSNIIEVATAGYPSTPPDTSVRLEFTNLTTNKTRNFPLTPTPTPGDSERWFNHRADVSPLDAGEPFRVSLIDQNSSAFGGWIALRDRVNFYRNQDRLVDLRQQLRQPLLSLALIVLLAFGLTWFITRVVADVGTTTLLATFLALTVVGLHLRPDVFFYWDEWHVLERLYIIGSGEILRPHNEHVIPLFFSWYLLESMLFGEYYLAYIGVSIALHIVNALLLTGLLTRISGDRRAASLCGVLFALSSVACEVLQWAFLQSVLLGTAGGLLALLAGWDFVATGKLRWLLICFVCTVLSPLCFGGALIIPVQIGLLLWLCPPTEAAAELRQTRLRQLAFATATAACLVVGFYIATRSGDSGGIGAKLLAAAQDPFKLLSYFFVATQVGAIFGGLGILPLIELQPPNPILPPALASFADNEVLFAITAVVIGALVLATFFVILRSSNALSSSTIRTLLLGELLILSAFVLPALGRAHFGTGQALSLRHQYTGSLWLFMLLVPLVAILREKAPKRLMVGVTAFLALHLSHIQSFEFFREHGRTNRAYTEQLREWNGLLSTDAEVQDGDFNAVGTIFENLYPVKPPHLAPDLHPDQIYRILHVFDPERYQFRDNFEMYFPPELKQRLERQTE